MREDKRIMMEKERRIGEKKGEGGCYKEGRRMEE